MCPAPRSGARLARRPAPVQAATKLAAAPVSSPDQATTALATVHEVHDGAKVTLTLIDAASAAIAQQESVTLAGVPAGANILVTPVFAPGSAIIVLVLAITVPAGRRKIRKAHQHTGGMTSQWATIWRSHHALAYFDRSSGAFTGPFHLSTSRLSGCPPRPPTTPIWCCGLPGSRSQAIPPDPGPGAAIPGERFPPRFGEGQVLGPAPAPWPGGEPVVTLHNGDVARLVRGRERRSARPGLET